MFAPEVLQTSAMDCGPAALTCLLEGFGVPANYVAIQAACQTDLDGTSIDTLEAMANTLGLDAEQVMVPTDHVLLDAANVLPSLAVVQRERTTHFLILWRRHGAFVQVMDPAKGRRWLRPQALSEELYIHRQTVPADAWREWAASPEFLGSVRERLQKLQIAEDIRTRLVSSAVDDAGWQSLALLDAATRMVTELVRARGLRPGAEAARVLETIGKRARSGVDPAMLVPENFWFAAAGESDDTLVLRGAVLLRVRGGQESRKSQVASRKSEVESRESSSDFGLPTSDFGLPTSDPPTPTSDLGLPTPDFRLPTSDLRLPSSAFAEMWHLVCDRRPAVPALIGLGVIVAAAGALFEVMWLRGVLEINNVLSLREQRLATLAMLIGFVGGLMLLDLAITSAVLRIGRGVETRLRAALLEKLPRIGENFFQSRLVSDLAHRAHNLDALRGIPDLGARFARTAMQLVFTAFALAWLDPSSTGVAMAAAALGIAIPLATERLLAERELRQRSHEAALTRHYLDSLIGLVPARMHSAERALRHQHEQLLVEWGRSSLHLLRGAVVVEGMQLLVGSLLAAWLVLGFASRGARPGSTLLLVYWTLTLPMLGRELAAILRQFPAARNILARILEPLNAPDESVSPDELPPLAAGSGVSISLQSVAVCVRGRRVLESVDLTIAAGEHVAIVGRSGAGKSTLAGLPLGWRTPSTGALLVDGEPLDRHRLADLRRATAWVDPAVRLWNRSLFDNLRYGDRGTIVSSIGSIIEEADLAEILEKLPSGLQSPLGEGGRLTSGGEGQRIRFGRALVRQPVRLAILDEPFRGLDRRHRRELLARARQIWRDQTMLCVTHDIHDTLSFERVLVMDEGRIVEDGDPAALAAVPESTFAQLLAAERAVHTELWADGRFRRWRLDGGIISEETERDAEQTWTAERQISRGR